LSTGARFKGRFYRAVKNSPSLEELHIKGLGIVNYNGLLSHILDMSKNLKYLNLDNSFLGTDGGTQIAQFLRSNHALEHLYLGNTGIKDDDGVKFADALKLNTNMRVLGLGGKGTRTTRNTNQINTIGRKALANILFDTSSLHTVANSNHTCRVDIVSSVVPQSLDHCLHEALLDILNCNSCPKDNRRWKVLSVIYATNEIGIGDEFETYQNLKVIPELLAFITASFDDVDEHIEEVHVGETPTSSIFPSLSSLFSSTSGKKEEVDQNSSLTSEADKDSSVDELSIESDESFDSYDSELEDLDEAFEEEEDEVYENFDKSFFDPSVCGERARLTIMFQVVQKWGLPLLDKTPPLPEQPEAEAGKQKRKRTTSWKCEPGKKGKKTSRMSLKKGSKEAVISQREIDSLAD